MFNKDNSIKILSVIGGKLYQYENIIVSESFVNMLSDYRYNKEALERMDYQDRITSYINKKHEYDIKKQYNPMVVKLYKDGLLIVNNKEYLLKDFYIVFDDNLNNFHLKSKYSEFNIENDNYNKAIKFIDTTAFIRLIHNDQVTVNGNKIILNDIEILNSVVNSWDGYIHSEVKETDAISNKRMIKGDQNE